MAATERRNPYLILGIDFAASPAAASAAFARVSRRLRRSDDAPFTLEDATWALHQVEQVATDPESSLGVFRVPANPVVYNPAPTRGILALEPQNLPRTTPSSEAGLLELQAQIIEETAGPALDALLPPDPP